MGQGGVERTIIAAVRLVDDLIMGDVLTGMLIRNVITSGRQRSRFDDRLSDEVNEGERTSGHVCVCAGAHVCVSRNSLRIRSLLFIAKYTISGRDIGLPGVRYLTGLSAILALFSGIKMIVILDNAWREPSGSPREILCKPSSHIDEKLLIWLYISYISSIR